MVNFDVGFGLTLNYETKSIAFIRLDARVNGLDPAEDANGQLEALDEKIDDTISYLKNKVSGKLKEIKKRQGN